MLVQPRVTYPGVYIQEVASDVRTITPVDTATTGFIGRAKRGPVDRPVVCNGYADFDRIFGGLWLDSSLGYAVNDFFLNGGSKAVVVRLFHEDTTIVGGQTKAVLSLPSADPGALTVFAAVMAAAGTSGKQPPDLVTAATQASASVAAAVTAKTLTAANQTAANSVKDAVTTAAGLGTADALKAAAAAAAATFTADPAQTAAKAVSDAVAASVGASKGVPAIVSDAATARDSFLNDNNGAAAQAAAKAVFQAVEAASVSPTNDSVVAAARQAVLSTTGTPNPLLLEAAYEGAWGNRLAIRVSDLDARFLSNIANRYQVPAAELFNLSVRDLATGASEEFANVTVTAGPRQLDKVLAGESNLVRVNSLSTTRPAASTGVTWDDPANYTAVVATGQANDGAALDSNDFVGPGQEGAKQGLYAFKRYNDIVNLLCIPPYLSSGDVDGAVLESAASYCLEHRGLLIVDPPTSWNSKDKATAGPSDVMTVSQNAALFFPRIKKSNPLRDNQVEEFAPCGVIAGVMARTDATRGVWKAAAGLEARLMGVIEPSISLTDPENGELNPLGVNCLRRLPAAGNVVWGARTTVGDDRLADQWKYVPVRRTALFIEESLYRGTQWAVFEPNDEPLWAQLRLNIGTFMNGLFRQGAFQGKSPNEAYFVKCDASTTTQAEIDSGIVQIVVGFAPLKPAEFVILYIQQIAGGTAA